MRWGRIYVLLGLLFLGRPLPSPGLQASFGLEYDDNLFEKIAESKRSGWVNRLFLSSSTRLLETKRGVLQLRHQWGAKRFWKSEEVQGSSGDVVASQLQIAVVAQLHERLSLFCDNEVKIKNVQRISSEESYLRGGLKLGLSGRLGKGVSAELRLRRSSDHARDTSMVDVAVNGLGMELAYEYRRNVQARLGLKWHWIDYERPILQMAPVDSLDSRIEDQADRMRELVAGVQFYRSILVHASYALLENDSNSVGFSYRAHRLQLLVGRNLYHQVDGQFYLTLQRRRYREELPQSLPQITAEESDYEQMLLSFKLSRQLTSHYGLSTQYKRSRNGSRQAGASFHKNIYSLALDINF